MDLADIKMKSNSLLLLNMMIAIFILVNQGNAQQSDYKTEDIEKRYPIIPLPVELLPQQGRFELNTKTAIMVEDEDMKIVADFLEEEIEESLGYHLDYKTKIKGENFIAFSYDTEITHIEGYTLTIKPNRIDIRFKSLQGAFYAVQTLKQLMQEERRLINQSDGYLIPSVIIKDYPHLSHRGYMLDVSRHFFSIDFLKKIVDVLAFYKLNIFHLHLTDDQGWRVEIKKYPKLHKVGAWREETQVGHRTDLPITFDGVKHGGYYTQNELKELVQYAEQRFITIIPEIDIPGHAQAILAAYPYLGCIADTTYEVSTIWGVHDNLLCPYEETFNFLEEVFDEIVNIFPGKYIHIGGDEVVKRRWKNSEFCQNLIKKKNLKDEKGLQSYFISRIEGYLNSMGKIIIGWDEILEGGLAPNATVMSWRGESGGIEAAQKEHPVIMTPNAYMYFNYYNTIKKLELEPLANSNSLPLKKVYDYHFLPKQLSDNEKQFIIGLQACLWTEYVKTEKQVEALTFPRLCAMSECAWTPQKLKHYDSFYNRLITNIKHLEKIDINYSPLFLNPVNNNY